MEASAGQNQATGQPGDGQPPSALVQGGAQAQPDGMAGPSEHQPQAPEPVDDDVLKVLSGSMCMPLIICARVCLRACERVCVRACVRMCVRVLKRGIYMLMVLWFFKELCYLGFSLFAF